MLKVKTAQRSFQVQWARPSLRAPFFLLLALLACWPYLSTAGAQNDFRDAQVLDHYEASARRTLIDYGEFPLWNPYYCGGLYALGSPQTRFATPFFLATVLFGTTRAAAILQWLLVLLALEGAYRLIRSFAVRPFAAMLSAPVFGLGGVFACAPFLGWVSFCGFALVPWVVWFTRRALRGHWYGALGVGACVAFMAGFGGTYTVPLTALAVATQFIRPLQRRRFTVALTSAASILFATLGLSAFRLLPVWETLRDAPRTVASFESHPLPEIGGLLFGTAAPYVAPECWYLVGIPAAAVAALELLRRRSIGPAVLLGLCVWLSMGSAATPSLFGLLRALPSFDMLRSPERFLILAGLVIAVCAGRALNSLAARARRSVRFQQGLAVAALALLVNSSMLIANFSAAARLRTLVAPAVEVKQPFHQARGNRWAVSEIGAANRGSLSCWEAYPVPQSRKLVGNAQAEAWLRDESAGTLEATAWAPNHLSFRASLKRPTRLIVNQNHHAGWRTSVGTLVNDEGLLAVELPEGDSAITLAFRPRSATVGFTVALLSLLTLLGLGLLSLPLGAAARTALIALPLVVGFVQYRLIDENYEKLEPRGPTGEPVLVDSLAGTDVPLNIDFEGGVRLVAAHAESADNHRLRLEFDWQVPERALSTLGFFVHVEPEGGKTINADHPFVSEALTLSEVPRGTIARDIVMVSVPPEARGKPLTVWVGLWALRGDGARMRVLSETPVRIDSNRVRAAVATVE